MVFAVELAEQAGLLEESTVWYKITWQKGTTLENQRKKLIWDFEYCMRKTTSARRPDLTLEDLQERKIWLIDKTESNIEDKLREKDLSTSNWLSRLGRRDRVILLRSYRSSLGVLEEE